MPLRSALSPLRRPFVALVLLGLAPLGVQAADNVIPHGQSQPPGPPKSPRQAIASMQVPEGFRVELVAAEPDLVNPVAMAFDAEGRIWVTESLEYPRKEAGPGRDRIKVLEDTDGDGRVDKTTIFADGLNIPSGLAIGHGGVWVANAPDILFLRDTDGDLKADASEVIVTGFGRDDTHELPNSLTWGPDGYLYGLNGVFNRSRVRQGDRTFSFTCAMFRIHPRTHAFELFAEGTSNPWGIAFNSEGSAFVSACVIDHLWHLAETGYYHRQAGAYPKHAWKIESIVEHKHQKAAYCGLEYFDSDAYPEPYRGRLYMGNIHGNCINVDRLTRNGSTYVGHEQPDFLSANDPWFMPVAQKTGPDGCLYVLDWYDRYHCYQDARRDPEGIDRGKGRLYRIRYQDSPRASGFNLLEESDEALVRRLSQANIFFRRQAQRILAERLADGRAAESTRKTLARLATAPETPPQTARHALWTLLGGDAWDESLASRLLEHDDPGLRAWSVRGLGLAGRASPPLREKLSEMARQDPAPEVLLQLAIAAPKLADFDALPTLLDVLERSGDDPLLPRIVWANLHPLLNRESGRFLDLIARRDLNKSPALQAIMPRATAKILDLDAP